MNTQPILDAVTAELPRWLPNQRWFSSGDEAPRSARVVDSDVLSEENAQLLWVLFEVDGDAIYQVPLGVRDVNEIEGTLLGHEHALIANVEVEGKDLLVYDALIDHYLGRVLFDVVCGSTDEVKSVRPLSGEQSNTSLIGDNREILKVFRRLHAGPNPDLEVTERLGDAGFTHVAPVIATWQRGPYDLAVCSPYIWDGTDGWKLALASVRDFLGVESTGGSSAPGSPVVQVDQMDPAQAGGDFADEARRLGHVTAGLHLALAEHFGTEPYDISGLLASLTADLDNVSDSQRPALANLLERLRGLSESETGSACRIHGDYHLGQTLRSVSGWYVFDFEGEPARPLTERTLPSSPLKDVSGMARSFGYAAAVGVFEQIESERQSFVSRANAWELRNRSGFFEGYFSADDIDSLLPPEGQARDLVQTAFEVEKAIYELKYEKAYRPGWVGIPSSAIDRLLKG